MFRGFWFQNELHQDCPLPHRKSPTILMSSYTANKNVSGMDVNMMVQVLALKIFVHSRPKGRWSFLLTAKLDISRHVKRQGGGGTQTFTKKRAAGLFASTCWHAFPCLLRWKVGWRFLERGIEVQEGFWNCYLAKRPHAPQSCHGFEVFISSHGYQLGLHWSTSSFHSFLPILPLIPPPFLFFFFCSFSLNPFIWLCADCDCNSFILHKLHNYACKTGFGYCW